MPTTDAVEQQIKALLETQIIQALNSAPEAIELMVKAALSQRVDPDNGRTDGYGTKVPYLEWMVGEQIREAARTATLKIIQERVPDIEAEVRKALSSEDVANAVVKSLVGAASDAWSIKVKFEAVK